MAFRPVGIMAFTMMLFAVRRWLLNRERSARQPNRFQCKLYRLWFLLGLAGMPENASTIAFISLRVARAWKVFMMT